MPSTVQSDSPSTAPVPTPAELVHAYLFGADGIGRRLAADAAQNWLSRAAHHVGDEFIWLHFSNPHNIDQRWLQYVDLAPMFKDVLHEERRSSRLAHAHHGGLFAVVNDVSYDLARRTEPAVATLWLSIRQHWLLSAWSDRLRSVDVLVAMIEDGHRFHNPMALLIALLAEQADVLMDIVRNAAATANAIETALQANRLPRRADLGGIRRDLVRLQRLLAPEPASLFRLVNRMPRWAKDDDQDSLHLATENFSVALRDMAGLQERIKLLEEEIAARVAERTNRGVFVLTSATVIALPLTIVAALFGMNVGGLPLHDSGQGFAVVVGVSVLATVVAAMLVMRLLRV